jgi:hypothetical protein
MMGIEVWAAVIIILYTIGAVVVCFASVQDIEVSFKQFLGFQFGWLVGCLLLGIVPILLYKLIIVVGSIL